MVVKEHDAQQIDDKTMNLKELWCQSVVKHIRCATIGVIVEEVI